MLLYGNTIIINSPVNLLHKLHQLSLNRHPMNPLGSSLLIFNSACSTCIRITITGLKVRIEDALGT